MTQDLVFTLLNSIFTIMMLVLSQPVFRAKQLADLDQALITRPILAKVLKCTGVRSHALHLLYCALFLLAYHSPWVRSKHAEMPLASLSVVVLLAVSLARVWKVHRLLASNAQRAALRGSFIAYPVDEQRMVRSAPVSHMVGETPPNAYGLPPSAAVSEETQCPACDSTHITTRNYVRRTGGAIGTVTGAAAGVAGVMGGAEIGATIGVAGGPLGMALGSLTGALIAAMVGGATGCAAGSAAGKVIDENCLNNYVCLDCGRTFSKQGR